MTTFTVITSSGYRRYYHHDGNRTRSRLVVIWWLAKHLATTPSQRWIRENYG